ncbi:MAG: hypothetical protein AAFR21_07905 [Pseudomonadota bacterium]
MTLNELAPLLALGAFLAITLSVATSPNRRTWQLPLLLLVAFSAWSIFAVVTEGPFGFWPEHIRNNWGNQIWFDLLLALGAAFSLMASRAKQLGMSPLGWLVFICLTGSIGMLAMLTRYLYLSEKEAA